MIVVRDFGQLPSSLSYPVLTIGNFDGVHRGHRQIIRTVIERAREKNGTAMVLTFDPHPLKVLAPEKAPGQIQTLEQKRVALEEIGVDILVIASFTLEFSRITARQFAEDVVCRKLGAREVHIGRHFVFGHNREGNVELLKALGRERGLEVREVPEIHYRHFRISSTRIRQFLRDGRVSLVRHLLDRPFSIQGRVVPGAGLGRQLGFPTANVDSENELLPGHGVYVTLAHVAGASRAGVTNVGVRPTVDSSGRTQVETHLLDAAPNLYGQPIRLEFYSRLRGEKKYGGVDQLSRAIGRDVDRALRYFRCTGVRR
ncbi:MAG: bifunctional riboflavin kinase/FAD synthetase [Acidobacteria bacterium]|nr:bifunctional riboflavin kinase/FAD synthetase [Acidobacteriota bacterium]